MWLSLSDMSQEVPSEREFKFTISGMTAEREQQLWDLITGFGVSHGLKITRLRAPSLMIEAPRADVMFDAMAAGTECVSYFVGNGGAIMKEDVLFFCDFREGKCGTLYWEPAGHRAKNPNKSILLHKLSDVYRGKQIGPFERLRHDPLIHASRCFSIVSTNASVHLEMPSEQIRNNWMAGIEKVFAYRGKRIQHDPPRQPPLDAPAPSVFLLDPPTYKEACVEEI